MKKIFVCSPLRGNIRLNMRRAKEYCRKIALQGDIPVAPHLYFPQFLDENNPRERKLGIAAGIELMKHCDEMRIFGDKISEGMRQEINAWNELKKKGPHEK